MQCVSYNAVIWSEGDDEACRSIMNMIWDMRNVRLGVLSAIPLTSAPAHALLLIRLDTELTTIVYKSILWIAFLKVPLRHNVVQTCHHFSHTLQDGIPGVRFIHDSRGSTRVLMIQSLTLCEIRIQSNVWYRMMSYLNYSDLVCETFKTKPNLIPFLRLGLILIPRSRR